MRKFNWDEFKDEDNKIAVHCKTEEEAKDFCKRMHEHGMEWRDGDSYLEHTEYGRYLSKTCYTGDGGFASCVFCESEGYKILEWSDYMDKEFTKADLEDGMVVKYRNGDKRMVINEAMIGVEGYSDKHNFLEDLTHKIYEELDIVGAYEAEEYGNFANMLSDNNLILIWERKEPKKMTVEEMRKKLEELTGEEIEVTE